MSRLGKAVLGIVALGAAFVPGAAAQKGTGVTLGIMAGANFAKATRSPASTDFTFSSRTGMVAGAFLGIHVSDVFSLEPEVLYSMGGSKLNGAGSSAGVTATVKLNYLQIPVLAKVRIPTSGGHVRPVLFAGPDVAFQLSCKVDGYPGVAANTDCLDQSVDFKTKKTDFGATFGGGIEIGGHRHVVRLDARYRLGLTNINNNANDTSTTKTRVFTVTAGFGFSLGK